MPRICSFYGIAIWIYWNDHHPPHFHAEDRLLAEKGLL